MNGVHFRGFVTVRFIEAAQTAQLPASLAYLTMQPLITQVD